MPFAMSTKPFDVTTSRLAMKETILYIVANGTKVDYRFYPNEVIVGREATLKIRVEPENSQGHDGSKIRIYSYCSSDTDIRRVRVKSIKARGTTTHVDVAETYDVQKEPYNDEIEEIVMGFSLEDRQLVFVGIIIELTRLDGTIEYYLCDPQVGNGPPGSTVLSSATQLFF